MKHGPINQRAFGQMLTRALVQEDYAKLRNVVDKLVAAGEDGQPWAIAMIADRLDGKAHQSVDVTTRTAESVSEEHARLVAESYIESLRSSAGHGPKVSGGVHGGDEAGLSASLPAPSDSNSPSEG